MRPFCQLPGYGILWPVVINLSMSDTKGKTRPGLPENAAGLLCYAPGRIRCFQDLSASILEVLTGGMLKREIRPTRASPAKTNHMPW